MRPIAFSVVLALSLIGAPTANAGIVDITFNATTGDVFLRTDPGLKLIVVGMQFGGGEAGTFTFAPYTDPPDIWEPHSLALPVPLYGGYFVQLNPEAVIGEFVYTNGAEILVGNFSGAFTSFDCSDCFAVFGGGVVDSENGLGSGETTDITAQTTYTVIRDIVPEPSALALIGLGVAGLLSRRVRSRLRRGPAC